MTADAAPEASADAAPGAVPGASADAPPGAVPDRVPDAGSYPEPEPAGAATAPEPAGAATAPEPARAAAAPEEPGATRRSDVRTTRRPSPSARRFGYLVSIAINVALLVVIHISPGWDAATFLTDAAGDVVPLLTLSIALTIAANVVWLVKDPLWLRAAGDLLGAVVGGLVSLQILRLFPFTFPDGSLWPTVLRLALWVAVVASAIGALANLVALIRALRHPERG